jgi:hypothetical protein
VLDMKFAKTSFLKTGIQFLIAILTWRMFDLALNYDDAYISLRYAQNFAEDFELVYNSHEQVFGISNLLFTLIIGLLSRLTSLTPELIGNCLAITSVFLTIVTVDKISVLFDLNPTKRAIIQAILLLSPLYLTITYMGMEAPMYSLFIILSIYFVQKKVYFPAGLFFGLSVFVRLDALIFGISFAVILLFHIHRKVISFKQIAFVVLGFSIPVTIYLVTSLHFFGTILPSTISTKINQEKAASRFWMAEWFLQGPALPLIGLFLLVFVLKKFLKSPWPQSSKDLLVVLYLWLFSYATVWTIVGIDLYPWYLSAMSPLFSIAFIAILSLKFSKRTDFFVSLLSVLIALYWGTYSVKEHIRTGIYVQQVEIPRKELAEAIKQNSMSESEIVGTGAPGIIGYFCGGCQIVDYGGLVSKGNAHDLHTTMQITIADNGIMNPFGIKQESILIYQTRGEVVGSPTQSIFLTPEKLKSSWKINFDKQNSTHLGAGAFLGDIKPLNPKLNLAVNGVLLKFSYEVFFEKAFPEGSLIAFYVYDDEGKVIGYTDSKGVLDGKKKFSELEINTGYLTQTEIMIPGSTVPGEYGVVAFIYPPMSSQSNQELGLHRDGHKVELFRFKIKS